jgi:hypothetical protein
MQPFASDLVPIASCHPRTTASSNSDFLDEFGERPFPKRTGRSTGKAPPTPLGRECQFAAFGCSHSPAILSRSLVATRERPLSSKSHFLDEFGERPFPKWTGRSTGKTPPTPLGRGLPTDSARSAADPGQIADLHPAPLEGSLMAAG